MPALPWGMPQPELEIQPEVEGPPKPSALPAPDDEPMNVGLIAGKYLTKLVGKSKKEDETFGPNRKTGNLRLGDAEFKTDGNDMIINGKRYNGTEGLWELVTMKKPRTGVYDGEDMKNITKKL